MEANPMFLTFSMASRRNRRCMVVCTYSLLLIGLALLLYARGVDYGVRMVLSWIYVLVAILTRMIFGRIVRHSVLPEGKVETVQPGLRLSAWTRAFQSEDVEDERDVAVRNRAYFIAYRILIGYVIAAWFAVLAVGDRNAQLAHTLTLIVFLLLWILAFTLPQVVLLWTEPDMPGENGV